MCSNASRSTAVVILLLLAAWVLPSSLQAQASPEVARDSVAAPATPTGPRVLPDGVPRSMQPSPFYLSTPQERLPAVGSNVVMMGAGAAGVVVGSIIGGDGGMMIAVGGGVAGLIGLYRFLR